MILIMAFITVESLVRLFFLTQRNTEWFLRREFIPYRGPTYSESIISNTQHMYSVQKKIGDRLINNTKQLYDFVSEQCKEHNFPSCPLDELLTEGFDEEQIWQEIELHNEPSLKYLLKNISSVVARKNKLTLQENRAANDGNNDSDGEEVQDEGEMDEEDEDESMDDEDDGLDDNDDSETNFDIDDLENQERESSRKRNNFKPKRTEPSVVDDKFFKLSEMEAFLEMEDAKEERKRRLEEAGKQESEEESSDEEDEFNYFDELPSSSEEDGISDGDDDDDDEVILSKTLPSTNSTRSREMRYKDYFPDPGKVMDDDSPEEEKKRKVHFQDLQEDEEKEKDEEESPENNDNDDDHLMEDAQLRNYLAMKAAEESESEGEDADDILGRSKPDAEKSSFEKRQERLRQRIDELEEANVAEKPWQLIGEVGGRKRPENSLLEETLDFEVASKPAPVITEETTASIETIIKQRILDQAWDDVERKIKPKEEAFEFKKRITLDQEKSKLSLGEIYEQEYLKKMQGNTEEEENPGHKEIKNMMDSLFVKLDALSNFHFSPKPVLPEVKIVTNVPAITMEEVQPISVADATLLAPEEIKEKQRSEFKGDTEKTKTDRKHERRKKKKGQKLRAKEKERKERTAGSGKSESGGKISKKDAMEKLEKASRMASSKTSIITDDANMEKKLLTSSKSFFGKLQEEAAAEVKGYQKKRVKKNPAVSSKKLKL